MMMEHRRDITGFPERVPKVRGPLRKSSFQRVVDKNHTEENMDILHVCRISRRMDSLEEFKIYKAFKKILPTRF